jgi:hypothetical protein
MRTNIADLQALGLLDRTEEPHLTDKGREWLRVLEDLTIQDVTDQAEAAADLVLSTNGLFR